MDHLPDIDQIAVNLQYIRAIHGYCRHPQYGQFAGHGGPPAPMNRLQIADSGAMMLFVAITSPRKEQFIHRWREQLGVKFAMGVGGTFDIVAGKTKRAPVWMQKAGLEWLFRIIQEPRRMWKRYLVTDSKFAWLLLRARLFGK